MAFDYAGGTFSDYSGYLANVHKGDDPNATPFATEPAIQDYIAGGVPPEKIVLGMPLYGRSYANTAGMGEPFDGVGDGSWADGNWDYKDLPRPGATVYNDFDIVGSYGYNNNTNYLVSFDTPEIQAKKADYITSTGLGGGWWWESSSDKTGADSLVGTVSCHPSTSYLGINGL
jgi:chitinase